ncbi:Atrophin-1 incomplete domain containing protein [Pandoravirus salinus]|uniref:Atrophin-1 incomplete domain containing protein n=1 Tax=Pandoravirus salinus TaxID=1349410 RepID=S4VX57_9VIRU|nr:Atrophin-1 superfamily incomplete domain [Pandoravirus salinus]AGO84953.2 Atrophin-1 incomplete domain containing protein [Pandoravirus salinus]
MSRGVVRKKKRTTRGKTCARRHDRVVGLLARSNRAKGAPTWRAGYIVAPGTTKNRRPRGQARHYMESNRRALPPPSRRLSPARPLARFPRVSIAQPAPAAQSNMRPVEAQAPHQAPLARPAPAQPVIGRFAPRRFDQPPQPSRAMPMAALGRFPALQPGAGARSGLQRPVAPLARRPALTALARQPFPALAAGGVPMRMARASPMSPTNAQAPLRPMAPPARLRQVSRPLRALAPTLTTRPDGNEDADAPDNGCVPGREQDTDALIAAIVNQDQAAIRRILARGRVDVNGWIDSERRIKEPLNGIFNVYLQGVYETSDYDDDTDTETVDRVSPELPQLVSPVERPDRRPNTLLELAVESGAPRSVEALIDAGARPWPTYEALLNKALSRVGAFAYGRPYEPITGTIDPVGTLNVLLRRFRRSPRLDPLDVNPLSVARLTLQRMFAFVHDDSPDYDLGLDMERFIEPLLAAGYSPDERERVTGRSPLSIDQTLKQDEDSYWLKALRGPSYESPEAYDQARAARARITERQAAETAARDAARTQASAYAYRVREEQARRRGPVGIATTEEKFADRTARALERVVALYDRWAPVSATDAAGNNLNAGTLTATVDQGDAGQEEEEEEESAGYAYDASQQTASSLLESVPPELLAAIAESRGLSARDVASLYRASRTLASLTAEPLARRYKAYQAYTRPGAPCGDYVGCASTLLAAINNDDADTVERVLESRAIRTDDLIYPNLVRQFADPATRLAMVREGETVSAHHLVHTYDEAVEDWSAARGPGQVPGISLGAPRWWPYTTPLRLAVAAKALDVVHNLAGAGARPWPSVESLLRTAVSYPTHRRAIALTMRTRGPENMTGYYDEEAIKASLDRIAQESAPYTDVADANTEVLLREADTPAVVRALTTYYPRDGPLGADDFNPLTALRLAALESDAFGGSARMGETDQVEAALAPIIQILLDAGYSPDERGLPCALDPTGTTERALVARWAADPNPQSDRAMLARIFGRAYTRVLPPLASADD